MGLRREAPRLVLHAEMLPFCLSRWEDDSTVLEEHSKMSWTKLCDGAPPCRELSGPKSAGCEVCRGTEWAEGWREGALCRREDDWDSREEDGVAYRRRETIGEIEESKSLQIHAVLLWNR